MSLGQSLLMYLFAGAGVALGVYLKSVTTSAVLRWFQAITAIPFWPLYVPLLLVSTVPAAQEPRREAMPSAEDEMAAAIAQVDAELEGALRSLDGWAEDVLAREKGRLHELRSAWTAQAERIREMDRLLSRPEYSENNTGQPPEAYAANERIQNSAKARQQNLRRLKQVRQRTYQDLMGTLAWVRELVSMIHLAKFTGAPASRAEELVAQIAAAVEGLSALTWQDDPLVHAGDDR